MPAKVTLYSQKGEIKFDFGTGPRNMCFFNPHGTLLMIAGFGNLRGKMECWDIQDNIQKISEPDAPDTTHFEWCPGNTFFRQIFDFNHFLVLFRAKSFCNFFYWLLTKFSMIVNLAKNWRSNLQSFSTNILARFSIIFGQIFNHFWPNFQSFLTNIFGLIFNNFLPIFSSNLQSFSTNLFGEIFTIYF